MGRIVRNGDFTGVLGPVETLGGASPTAVDTAHVAFRDLFEHDLFPSRRPSSRDLAVVCAAPQPTDAPRSSRIAHTFPPHPSTRLQDVVGSSLRYTPAGGTVTVSVVADPRGVAIEVRDTGAGILPDGLPHVFDRKSGDSRGSGLGLAIAKGLVVAHGVEITSDGPGRGTAMRFTLPRAAPPRGPAPPSR